MGHASHLTAPVLEQFLLQARLTKAVASLRLQGAGSRLLGDLRIQTFRPGSTLELSGLNARDSVPSEGMPVTLTILLGEEVLTLESLLLPPSRTKRETPSFALIGLTNQPAFITAGMSAWPHRTNRPLKVRVTLNSRQHDALLMNLTETGVGLALDETLMVDLHATVGIDAELPDGTLLRCPAEIRHVTYLEGQDFPTRLGLVLTPGPDTDLESVHRFIQVRRTDRSQSFRRT